MINSWRISVKKSRSVSALSEILPLLGTLDAKSPVQILVDIEIALNEYMKLIKYVHNATEDKDGKPTVVSRQSIKNRNNFSVYFFVFLLQS